MYLKKTPVLFRKLFPEAVWSSQGDSKLRWTFDDGPHPDSTLDILEFLKENNITATFFCLGKNVEQYPELYKQILAAGHQVGNHGYEHISGWNSSLNSYLTNIKKASEIIDSDLFRPAYGRMTWKQYKSVTRLARKQIVMWSDMPGDFETKLSPQRLSKRMHSTTDENSIIVLHDNPQAFEKFRSAWSIKPLDSWN